MTHTPPSLRPRDGSVHHLPLTGQAASVAPQREAAAPACLPVCLTCHLSARRLASAHVLARAVKLEHAGRNPPPLRWAGAEQPAVWTDVLAEMSRHIYIRNKIGEGIPAPIFQVGGC